jgi:hypothetical protein
MLSLTDNLASNKITFLAMANHLGAADAAKGTQSGD